MGGEEGGLIMKVVITINVSSSKITRAYLNSDPKFFLRSFLLVLDVNFRMFVIS